MIPKAAEIRLTPEDRSVRRIKDRRISQLSFRVGGRDDLQQSAARHGLLVRELERACRDCCQSRRADGELGLAIGSPVEIVL
jgi:hypothetical protein